jgi:glutathione peroxidase-family protein
MYPNKPFFSNNFKVVIFTLFSILIVNTATAQKNTERFCRLEVIYKSAHKQAISINYGNKQDFKTLNDTTTIIKLDSVNNFENDIDAINYMSKLGWSFTGVFSLTRNLGPEIYVYIFRKTYEITK